MRGEDNGGEGLEEGREGKRVTAKGKREKERKK